MAGQKIRIKLSAYDKASREQFELRTHKRIIDIYSPNAKLLDTIHLPAGVDIKVKLG